MLKSALTFVNDALPFLNRCPVYSIVLVAFHKDNALQVLFKPWQALSASCKEEDAHLHAAQPLAVSGIGHMGSAAQLDFIFFKHIAVCVGFQCHLVDCTFISLVSHVQTLQACIFICKEINSAFCPLTCPSGIIHSKVFMIISDLSDRYKLEFEKYYRKVNQNYICKYAV